MKTLTVGLDIAKAVFQVQIGCARVSIGERAARKDPIHTRCTRISASEPIGVVQNVLATDLVVEQIEAEGGLRLGFAVELSLKAPDFIRRCQAHHQSPSPHHLQKRTRSRGPLLRRHYPASTLLLPRPTPAVTIA
jgi:hypothetical protein